MNIKEDSFPQDFQLQFANPPHQSSDLIPPDGIYEVATVPECDELPYVFEVSDKQKLTFSFAADSKLSLTLCSEQDYDRWVDGGFALPHPEGFEIHLANAESSKLEFRPLTPGCLVAVLVNLNPRPASVVVAATIAN